VAFLARSDIELDALALLEGAVSVHLDRRVVDKHGVVFFASSHPLRGGVLVVLAVASAVGAWLSARYR
jgi:hypothetical protein